MRVCLVSSFPPMVCGIGDHASVLSAALASKGLDVRVITYSDGGEREEDLGLDGTKGRVTIHRVLGARRDCFSLPAIFRMVKPDVLQFESATARHSNLVNLNVLRKGVIPLVTSVHDAPSLPGQFSKVMTLQMVYRRSDLLVAHSRNVQARLSETNVIPLEKIQRIPLGVNTKTFRPRKKNSDGTYDILFYGIIRPEKGLEYLLQAMRRLTRSASKIRLVIAGPVEQGWRSAAYFKRLLSLIREFGLNERMRYIGERIVGARAAQLFNEADVVVFPYVGSSNSFTVLHAMSCARPILCSSVGGFREFVRDGIDGLLVPPRSGQALADALIRLEDPYLRARLGGEARERVERSFAMDNIVDEYIRIYGTLT